MQGTGLDDLYFYEARIRPKPQEGPCHSANVTKADASPPVQRTLPCRRLVPGGRNVSDARLAKCLVAAFHRPPKPSERASAGRRNQNPQTILWSGLACLASAVYRLLNSNCIKLRYLCGSEGMRSEGSPPPGSQPCSLRGRIPGRVPVSLGMEADPALPTAGAFSQRDLN